MSISGIEGSLPTFSILPSLLHKVLPNNYLRPCERDSEYLHDGAKLSS